MSFSKQLRRVLSLNNIRKIVADLETRVLKLETFAGMIVSKAQDEQKKQKEKEVHSLEISYVNPADASNTKERGVQ